LGLPYAHNTYPTDLVRYIEPDYTKLVLQLFLEVGQHCIEHGELEILLTQVCHFLSLDKGRKNFPSWVPGWTSASRYALITAMDDMIHANQENAGFLRIGIESQKLLVGARVVNVVAITSNTALHVLTIAISNQKITSFRRHNILFKDSVSVQQYALYEKIFIQTLMCDVWEVAAVPDWPRVYDVLFKPDGVHNQNFASFASKICIDTTIAPRGRYFWLAHILGDSL
jgi:hypothetical protein